MLFRSRPNLIQRYAKLAPTLCGLTLHPTSPAIATPHDIPLSEFITTTGSLITTTSYHASLRSTKIMSSTTSTRSTKVQNSRLLDLPGGMLLTFQVAPQFILLQRILTATLELRNRIYTLAIEDANSTLLWSKEPLFLIHAKENEAQTTLRATEDWSRLCRTYLGLTQTCAQLRSEFLPLYRENLKLVSCVDISVIVPYKETFILPYQGLDPPASPLTCRTDHLTRWARSRTST
jgi:hypothetical protein